MSPGLVTCGEWLDEELAIDQGIFECPTVQLVIAHGEWKTCEQFGDCQLLDINTVFDKDHSKKELASHAFAFNPTEIPDQATHLSCSVNSEFFWYEARLGIEEE